MISSPNAFRNASGNTDVKGKSRASPRTPTFPLPRTPSPIPLQSPFSDSVFNRPDSPDMFDLLESPPGFLSTTPLIPDDTTAILHSDSPPRIYDSSPPPQPFVDIPQEAHHPFIDSRIHQEMKMIFTCLGLASLAAEQFLDRFSTGRLPHGLREFLNDVVLNLPKTEADWPWARRDIAEASVHWLRADPVTIVEAIGNQVPEGPLVTTVKSGHRQRIPQIFDTEMIPVSLSMQAQDPEEVPMRLFVRKPQHELDVGAGVSMTHEHQNTRAGQGRVVGRVKRVRTTPKPIRRPTNDEEFDELVAGPSRHRDALVPNQDPSLLFSSTATQPDDRAEKDARIRGLCHQWEVQAIWRKEEAEAERIRKQRRWEILDETLPDENIPENESNPDLHDDEVCQMLDPDLNIDLSPLGSPSWEEPTQDSEVAVDKEEGESQTIGLFGWSGEPSDSTPQVESKNQPPLLDTPSTNPQQPDVPSPDLHPTNSKDEVKLELDLTEYPPSRRQSLRIATIAARTTENRDSPPIVSTSRLGSRPTRGRKSLAINKEDEDGEIPLASTSTSTRRASGPQTKPAKRAGGKMKVDLDEWKPSRQRKRKRDEEDSDKENEPRVADKERRPMKKLRSRRRT